MKKILFSLSLFALAVGCHGQIPPATTHVVNITITTVPIQCTTASPCSYAVYRCSLSATACADTANAAWAEITTSSTRFTGTSYTDSTASGLTAFYAAVAYQGASHSGASNVIGPLVVPASPLAPVVNGNTASIVTPMLKADPGAPQVAKLEMKAVVR